MPHSMDAPEKDVIGRLYGVILSRRGADPAKSYVAKLYGKGRHKMAQKVGEEAVEAILAAMDPKSGKDAFIGECADLLFHLLVLWSEMGVKPEEVYAKLAERDGTSGLSEKAARKPL